MLVPAALFATRAWWLGRALTVLGPPLARRAGFELSLERASGDGLYGLVLEGLRLAPRRGERSELARFDAERLELDLSIVAWLRGARDVGPAGVTRVRGAGVDVELDFSQASESGGSAGGDGGDGGDPALSLPAFAVEDGHLLIRLPEGHELEAEGVTASTPVVRPRVTDSEETAQRSAVRARRFAWRGPGREERAGRLAATIALDARGIDVDELVVSGELDARGVRVAWADGPGLDWRGELSALGGSLRTEGSVARDRVTLEVDAEDLRAGELLGLVFPELPPLRAGAERLAARLDVPFEDTVAGLAGEVELDLREVELGARAPFDVAGRAAFAQGEARASRLSFAQPSGAPAGEHANLVVLEDLVVPLADMGFESLLARGRARASVDARDLPALLGAERAAPEHHLELWASLRDGRADVERGKLSTPGGSFLVRGGSVRAAGRSVGRVELDLFADFDDLAPLAAILDTPRWAGGLRGAVALAGDWPDVTGTAALAGSGVVVAGLTLGELEVDLSGGRRRIDVARLTATSSGAELALSGGIDLVARRAESLDVRLDVADLGELLGEGDASGSLSLVAAAAGRPGELEGSFELKTSAIELLGRAVPRLEAQGALAGDRVRVASLAVESLGARLDASGAAVLDERLLPVAVELETLRAVRAERDLVLVHPVSVALAGGRPRVDEVPLSGSAGDLVLYARDDPDALRFGAHARGLDATALLAPFLPAGVGLERLDGSLEGERSADRLEFTTEGEARELSLAAVADGAPLRAWDASWKARYAGGTLVLEILDARSGGANRVRAAGKLPLALAGGGDVLAPGELFLKARAELADVADLASLVPASFTWPTGELAADVDLAGSWAAVTGTADFTAESLDLDIGGETVLRGADFSGGLRLGEAVELSRVSVVLPLAFTLRVDGRVEGAVDLRRLERGEPLFPGDTALDLTAGAIVEDTAWIKRLSRGLGGDFLRRLAGRMAASVDVGGTLASPRPVGEIELDGGGLKLSPELPAVENVAALLRIDGGKLEIASMAGELGAAPFTVSGSVDLGATPAELDVRLAGENLLLYRALGVKARADADLTVKGPADAPALAGDVVLQDSRFVKRFDFVEPGRRAGVRERKRTLDLFSFREPPLAGATFDVHVTSAQPFRIDNNVADARLRPDLRLVGTGETPELQGTIYVDRGKVVLPAYDLFLRPGTITFGREDPMVPRLELQLGNRIRGYEVTVNVSGPWDEPEVLMSSSPPLSEEDLFAMVWAGQEPGEGLSSRTGVRGAQAVGVYLAKDLVTRFLSDESTESEESFLDRFELYLGRDTTQNGDETIEATYRIASKALHRAGTLYLATEQDEYSHFNYGLRFVFRFE